MKWKEMSAEERYRVVEMARTGQIPKTELSRKLGISRQTLDNAIKKADQAALEALTPKERGRKGKSEQDIELEAMKRQQAKLEKELKDWKTKYEIAKAFIDLQRRLDEGKPLPGQKGWKGKKKKRRKKR